MALFITIAIIILSIGALLSGGWAVTKLTDLVGSLGILGYVVVVVLLYFVLRRYTPFGTYIDAILRKGLHILKYASTDVYKLLAVFVVLIVGLSFLGVLPLTYFYSVADEKIFVEGMANIEIRDVDINSGKYAEELKWKSAERWTRQDSSGVSYALTQVSYSGGTSQLRYVHRGEFQFTAEQDIQMGRYLVGTDFNKAGKRSDISEYNTVSWSSLSDAQKKFIGAQFPAYVGTDSVAEEIKEELKEESKTVSGVVENVGVTMSGFIVQIKYNLIYLWSYITSMF